MNDSLAGAGQDVGKPANFERSARCDAIIWPLQAAAASCEVTQGLVQWLKRRDASMGGFQGGLERASGGSGQVPCLILLVSTPPIHDGNGDETLLDTNSTSEVYFRQLPTDDEGFSHCSRVSRFVPGSLTPTLDMIVVIVETDRRGTSPDYPCCHDMHKAGKQASKQSRCRSSSTAANRQTFEGCHSQSLLASSRIYRHIDATLTHVLQECLSSDPVGILPVGIWAVERVSEDH